jgi:hypothetical protein
LPNIAKKHLEGTDKNYLSVRDHTSYKLGSFGRLNEAFSEEPIEISDLEGFRNSFRIIAKQKSFQKKDNLFVIDADFDVLYTIELSPQYQEKLKRYIRTHGDLPLA